MRHFYFSAPAVGALAFLSSSACTWSTAASLAELDGAPSGPDVELPTQLCRTDGVFAVSGTRPSFTRVLAEVDGDTQEIAALEESTDFEGRLELDEGEHRVKFFVENGAGTRSKKSAATTLTVEKSAPIAPDVTFAADTFVFGATAAFVIPASNHEAVCESDGAEFALTNNDDGTWSGSIEVTLPEHHVSCTLLSACGTESEATVVTLTGTEDIVAAPIVVSAPAPARLDAADATTTITITGTVEANTSVTASINGIDSTATVNGTSFTLETTLGVGSHAVSLVASRGEASSEATVVTVVLLPPIAAPVPTCDALTAATTLEVSGSRPANTAVWVSVDGAPHVSIDAADSSTNFSGDVDLSDVSDGEVELAFVAEDAVGFSDEALCTVVVDRTAPDAPEVFTVSAVLATGVSSGTISIEGRGEALATIEATFNSTAVTGEGSVTAEGNFTFPLSVNTITNPNTISVVLRDAAGNASTATAATFTVRNALQRPTLTNPSASAFPLLTNVATRSLSGSRPSGVGVLARVVGGSDQIIVANGTPGTAITGTLTLTPNASTSFCLYSFNASEESDARCLTDVDPYVITHDNVAPSVPVLVDAPATVAASTLSLTVRKDALSSVEVKVGNGSFSTLVNAQSADTEVTASGIALAVGSNTVCVRSSDAAANRSAEVCTTVSRNTPFISFNAPQNGSFVDGDLALDVELANGTTSSFLVCTTPLGGSETCSVIAATNSALAAIVSLDAASDIVPVTLEVCADTICDTRTVLQWAQPEQLSTSVSTAAKAAPAAVVDPAGAVHIVWQDVTDVCSTGHLDVITAISRGAQNKLSLTVSRPQELGLTTGSSFSIVGTNSFNGSYTVASVVNGTITTNQAVATGDAETSGNIVEAATNSSCTGPDIFYVRIDADGATAPINLSDVGGDAASSAPSLAVDVDGDVHVAWQEGGNLNPQDGNALPPDAPADGIKTDIVHRRIAFLTGAISLPTVVSTQDDTDPSTTAIDDRSPTLAASSAGVAVVWEAVGASNARAVLLSRLVSDAWTTPGTIASRTTTVSMQPALALGNSGTAYVAWVENSGRTINGGAVGVSGDRDILLCAAADGDNTCASGAEHLVSTGSDLGNSAEPALACDDGRSLRDDDEAVSIVWSDDLGAGASSKRILFRRFLMQIQTGVVSGASTQLTSSGNGQNPTIAADDDGISVVFTDNTPTGGHEKFTVQHLSGVRSDANVDGLDDTATFAASALLIDEAGSFTTADSAPAIALNGDQLLFSFVHQDSSSSVDSEIFAWWALR